MAIFNCYVSSPEGKNFNILDRFVSETMNLGKWGWNTDRSEDRKDPNDQNVRILPRGKTDWGFDRHVRGYNIWLWIRQEDH